MTPYIPSEAIHRSEVGRIVVMPGRVRDCPVQPWSWVGGSEHPRPYRTLCGGSH